MFNLRLSLIPEQHSVIDECEEPDEDDDTRPLESTFDNDRDDSPTGSKFEFIYTIHLHIDELMIFFLHISPGCHLLQKSEYCPHLAIAFA